MNENHVAAPIVFQPDLIYYRYCSAVINMTETIQNIFT